MSKPQAVSIKDLLIKKLSIKFNQPAKVIESVINHQSQAIHTALQSDTVFSLEMSGFGKWLFNHKKAQKVYQKNLEKKALFEYLSQREDITETKKESYKLKLDNTNNFLDNIKPKLDKCPSLQNI